MTPAAPAPAGSALILHGPVGPAATADDLDTLVQVRAVEAALRSLGLAVRMLEIGLNLEDRARRLEVLAPDFVFNLVEQIDKRDALLPVAAFFLERAGIPYTGADAGALAATTHKPTAKRLMSAAGIPTPEWLEGPALATCSAVAEGRWIVKSATEHASFGLSAAAVVPAEGVCGRVRRAVEEHGGSWFAERYIEGRELNVALLADEGGPEVLPLTEIEFVGFPEGAPEIVDYAAKWEPDSAAYRNTRRRFSGREEPALTHDLIDIALRCWRLFGLRGYARIDFRVDREGRPWVLEVNANPCLSPDAGFAAAAEAAGIGYVEIIGRIVRDAGVALPATGGANVG